MLLCDNVRLSNLQIVLCDRAPTPGSLRFANALPTSACVTPSFVVNIYRGMLYRLKVVEEKEEKRLGKKIKKQQQFFADGTLDGDITSAYAIRRRSAAEKKKKSLSKFIALISKLYLWRK